MTTNDLQIDEEVLSQMRARQRERTRWAAYQNAAVDSSGFGHLAFLLVGEGCTFAEAPERLPDSPTLIGSTGWKYVHIGFVDLDAGKIVES